MSDLFLEFHKLNHYIGSAITYCYDTARLRLIPFNIINPVFSYYSYQYDIKYLIPYNLKKKP